MTTDRQRDDNPQPNVGQPSMIGFQKDPIEQEKKLNDLIYQGKSMNMSNNLVQGESKDDKGPVVPLELSQMEKYAEKVISWYMFIILENRKLSRRT
jgi:hypothetical protein